MIGTFIPFLVPSPQFGHAAEQVECSAEQVELGRMHWLPLAQAIRPNSICLGGKKTLPGEYYTSGVPIKIALTVCLQSEET